MHTSIKEAISVDPLPVPSIVTTHVPLADKNWFKTGGNARWWAEPTTAQEWAGVVRWARANGIPLFILGHGANVLISDTGFDGLVIRPALRTVTHEYTDATHGTVTAQAGVAMSDLITYCLDHQLLGLEEFSGIPGTVGGSVYINLHYFEFLLAHFLVGAELIDATTGTINIVNRDWFAFGYNSSRLQEHTHYIVSATFALTRTDSVGTAYARGRSTEIIRHRVKRYPAAGTCGSFFRNFHDHEVTYMSNGKKMIYVAYYLDKIGVKGNLTVGGATVSYQHANMLVNTGAATSNDLITLARTLQERVKEQFGVTPQPECLLVGFPAHPLLAP